MYRTEKDILGEREIPAEALYGIHSVRARENFPGNNLFPVEWYKAIGITKLACYNTYRKFRDAASEKYGSHQAVRHIPDEVLDAMTGAAGEISEGKYFESFIVPAIQGGAGTSINMNVNEIIANVSLIKSGRRCGEYGVIDPVESANIYQSTNDVIPTALTVASMRKIEELESAINQLRSTVESLEKNTRDMLRPGYTQMQAAVPSSFGILFSTYNDALSRDWWRVSKCTERLKPVNLGGGATGTGMGIPRYFVMNVVPELRRLTGLPLSQGENLADATSNLDRWVEVHATLKSLAVNLEKMVSDIRLLGSDIAGTKTVTIPEMQAGSSIMPGKINPVIAEFVISASHRVYSNDILVTSLSSQGCLELNAYIPAIGYAVLESLSLLAASCTSAARNLLSGLKVDQKSAYDLLMHTPSITTALIPLIGYHKAGELAEYMKEKGCDIFEANDHQGAVDKKRLEELLQPGNLLKSGFTLDEIQ